MRKTTSVTLLESDVSDLFYTSWYFTFVTKAQTPTKKYLISGTTVITTRERPVHLQTTLCDQRSRPRTLSVGTGRTDSSEVSVGTASWTEGKNRRV